MPANAYLRSFNQKIKKESNPLLKTFLGLMIHQLRTPILTRYKLDSIIEFLKASFDLIQNRPADQILIDFKANGRHCTLQTNLPDQPFIVDTIRMHLTAEGATSISGYNATLGIQRNEAGDITGIGESEFPTESILRFDIDGLNIEEIERIQQRITASLHLARAMVKDFEYMTAEVERTTMRFERKTQYEPDQLFRYKEVADFLRWLQQENFVFMGIYTPKNAYGFFKEGLAPFWKSNTHTTWRPECEDFPIAVRKGSIESPVHRLGQVDEIYVDVPSEHGTGSIPLIIQGLFTYRAVTQSSRHVPLLRQTLATLLKNDGALRGSYRYKGICNVFDSLPTEFLFSVDAARLNILIDQILEAEQEQEARAHVVQTDRSDTTFVLTALPRGRWSENLRDNIETALTELTGATYCDHGVFVGRYNTMLVHFYLTGTKALNEKDISAVESRLVELSTPWDIHLSDALSHSDELNSEDIISKYSHAFQETYKQKRPIHEAIRDIELLEQLSNRSPIVDVFTIDERQRAYLRVYQRENLLLSDMLPIIDHFGLVITDQFVDPVVLSADEKYTIDTFRLRPIQEVSLEEIEARKSKLAEGLEAVFMKKMTSDPMNRLVLRADIPWQAVDMFRAMHGYAVQLGFRYSIEKVQSVLLSKLDLVQLLWQYFEAKFNPDGDDTKRPEEIKALEESINDSIRHLQGHDQDLVFRTYFNLLHSIIRTNFYRTDRIEHYLSFKVECARVQNMSAPRMMYEIYVHHQEMEGIHLRGGKIARGGIRWSDRTDFRREILDLVSTQMVKNVLIVPEGAKGGFRLKQDIANYKERRIKADERYKILIRGLLDVTDNTVNGKIVHPPRVVRHDAPDPYLVVAADKGTAHLSDTANGLSAEYGFWLGDAFASGGSNGYDHKKVGITARGGWVTTRRHFEELGLNPEKDVFTAVGIGDPAGDVFGNGVVYLNQKTMPNNKMKLLGAFNHLHIFLDPDPDTEQSYQERVRLFEKVAGWDQYDTSKISKGGGVFERSSKSIPLSPEIQEMLGVLKDELSPEVVIRLLLRKNVDLLWNGGIGTYVKASSETNLDAGDPSNDHLRINAEELRARILGEGGNLGFTQNGRIEYALVGGRLNTDAIDNSGGVDMSDHEVNLKILLNPLVQKGSLSLDDRNTLLESMTEEVAQDVLRNNDIHGRQISLDKLRSEQDALWFSSAIQWVCNQSQVTRAFLRLPTDDELALRQQNGQGLTRPELAVLSAHVKMHIFKQLNAADPAEIPQFNERVRQYFPQKVQEQFKDEIDQHMLHQSIGMTVLLNQIVGEAGAWLFPSLMDITDAKAPDIIKCWLIALDTIDAQSLIEDVKRSCPDLNTQYAVWVNMTKPLYSLLTSWLFTGNIPSRELQVRMRAILERIPQLYGSAQREQHARFCDELQQKDIPSALASRISALRDIQAAFEIAQCMSDSESIDSAIVTYFAIGEASLILPIIRRLETRRASGEWDPAAHSILRSRFYHLQAQLFSTIDLGPEAKLGIDRVALRLSRNHLQSLRAEMENILGDSTELASFVVANARAQGQIRRGFSAENKRFGTGVG